MQKEVVIPAFTLTAVPTPATLTVALTPTSIPAAKCTAASQSMLITNLVVNCTCSGVFAPGATFSGTGSGTIVASTPRVTCEGQSILTQDDSVTISCSGTVTTSGGGSPGTASVKVTITAAGQLTVNANKA
jgi:hypothetical protein